MPQVGCSLTRLLSKHEKLWADETEGVNDDLSLDGLDGINDNCDGSRGQLLEGLLCVDIDGGQPAAEAGMGVIPADNGLRSGSKGQ